MTDLLPEFPTVAIASLGTKDPGFDELEQLDKTRVSQQAMLLEIVKKSLLRRSYYNVPK